LIFKILTLKKRQEKLPKFYMGSMAIFPNKMVNIAYALFFLTTLFNFEKINIWFTWQNCKLSRKSCSQHQNMLKDTTAHSIFLNNNGYFMSEFFGCSIFYIKNVLPKSYFNE